MWLGCYLRAPVRVQGRDVEGLESYRGGLLESFRTFPKPESSLLKLNQFQFIKKKKMLSTNTRSLLTPISITDLG